MVDDTGDVAKNQAIGAGVGNLVLDDPPSSLYSGGKPPEELHATPLKDEDKLSGRPSSQNKPPFAKASDDRPLFETVSAEEEKILKQEPPPPPLIEEAPPELKPAHEPEHFAFIEGRRGKYVAILAAGIFFIGLFSLIFFFVARGRQPEEVTLTYWGLWEEKEVIQPILAEYQAKNKHVKIEYVKKVPQEYREKLLAQGSKGQGPDIFKFHNTWLPEMKEILSPIPSSIMSTSEFEKTFYPIHQKDLKSGNSYFGMPLSIDGLILVYNEGLFKKAGIQNPPTSWEDVIEAVAKLTVKSKEGAIITSGIALGTASNIEHFSDVLGLFVIQNGGDIRHLESPEAAGALESYRRFAEPPENFWDETMPNSIMAFTQEKVAMLIVPSWQILAIKAANPELALKAIEVPVIPGTKPVSLATYWVDGVSRYSKNQVEAWKLLSYLAQKDTMTKHFELQARSRLFGEAHSRVDLKELMVQNEYLRPVVRQGEVYVTVPVISRTYDNGLNDEIIKYLENAVNTTVQGVSYDSAFQTAAAGVAQVFTRYNIE